MALDIALSFLTHGAILDGIHTGALNDAPTEREPVFGLSMVTECPNVPQDILVPKETWTDPGEYDKTAGRLAKLFRENFKSYANEVSEAVRAAGPGNER